MNSEDLPWLIISIFSDREKTLPPGQGMEAYPPGESRNKAT